MANIIQIKHGTGVPDHKLAPYELGYMDDSGHLYIGGPYENEGTKTYGTARTLNYLPLDKNGYIPTLYSNTNLTFSSTAANPKVQIESSKNVTKVTFGLTGKTGQGYFLEYAPNSTHYERYNFPAPSQNLTDDIGYTILTTKGGAFDGDFVFNNTLTVNGQLTANGAIVVDKSSYGDYDPNGVPGDSSKPAKDGVVGQLYFVVTG